MQNLKTENSTTYIYTVNSFEEARKKVLELEKEGVGVYRTLWCFWKRKSR